jgi:hypothetical protein
MIRSHAGVRLLVIVTCFLLGRLGTVAVALQQESPIPSQATNILSIAPTIPGASTNDALRLALQPGQTHASKRLFGSNLMNDENDQAFILLPGDKIYQGQVRNGKPDGEGTVTSPNGTHQWGEFRDGLSYRLTGIWIAPDGTREEGTWNLDGAPSGGTITWIDGRVYKGEWKLVAGAAEQPEGTGSMSWPDGRVYVGQFRDGKMEGHGKMKYPNGKIEEGVWKSDQFAGHTP